MVRREQKLDIKLKLRTIFQPPHSSTTQKSFLFTQVDTKMTYDTVIILQISLIHLAS